MDVREITSRRPAYHAMSSREDCWSEGATSALIDAWGDRYVELNRGNLRQKHWQEVADAVNSRSGAGNKPRRTDVQCKNRIDTLKKKYKTDKAKILSSDGAIASEWQFFTRLDDLIGPAPAVKKSSPPLALPWPYTKNPPSLPQAVAVRPFKEKRPLAAVDDSFFRRNYAAAAAAAAAAAGADSGSSRSSTDSKRRAGEEEPKNVSGGDGDGFHQLAQAIERFAETYERVEEAKQRQLMELEKERMEFAKSLEFQRMQLFMDWQIQLEKVKRAKRSAADSYL